jgi:hypothetical protein
MRIDSSERQPILSCTASTNDRTPSCPMCGGVLVPTREAWRCSRCYFSLCEGCEPVSLADSAAGE